MAGYLSVIEAQERILSFFQRVETELVAVDRCAGRILAEEISAPGELPPFDNSSMDGFAVHAQDVQFASKESPVTLKVIADIPAGANASLRVQSGQAARIMTGAPLPDGADAVVPVEDTEFAPSPFATQAGEPLQEQVTILHSAQTGANIRKRGSDVQEGQVLLQAGRKLQPQDVGILASTGHAQVRVYRKPRIALFSSGDELVQPGQPLGSGQIYDSNQYVLAALLEREGAEVIRLGTAADDPEQVEAFLKQAVHQNVELIVTSAGVSLGAFDFVRQVIERQGRLEFWKVNMRPGKPLAFGIYSGIPLIGLPGNPVSAFVGSLVFVLPVLYRLAGRTEVRVRRAKAVLAEPVESDGRESYLRAVVREAGGKLVAHLTGHQGSGNLFSLVLANALLIVPSGVKSLPSDSEAEVWFLEHN